MGVVIEICIKYPGGPLELGGLICNKRILYLYYKLIMQLNGVLTREEKRGQQRDQIRWPWQEGIHKPIGVKSSAV
jgi:hypothetical protein